VVVLCRTVWHRCSAWMIHVTARHHQNVESARQSTRRKRRGVSRLRHCRRSPTSNCRRPAVRLAWVCVTRPSVLAADATFRRGTRPIPSPVKLFRTRCPSTGCSYNRPGYREWFRTQLRRRHRRQIEWQSTRLFTSRTALFSHCRCLYHRNATASILPVIMFML